MTTSLKNMEIVQPFEPSMIRCKFGIGSNHVKDGKLEKGGIAQEQKTQINHVNALKMDANLHDKSEHGNMHLCTKAVVWGLFEVLSPAIVRYQSLYKEKLNAYITNEANFVTKPEHDCHWLPGKFDQKLDENCIDPQETFEKLFAIPDKLGTHPELLEYSINLVNRLKLPVSYDPMKLIQI